MFKIVEHHTHPYTYVMLLDKTYKINFNDNSVEILDKIYRYISICFRRSNNPKTNIHGITTENELYYLNNNEFMFTYITGEALSINRYYCDYYIGIGKNNNYRWNTSKCHSIKDMSNISMNNIAYCYTKDNKRYLDGNIPYCIYEEFGDIDNQLPIEFDDVILTEDNEIIMYLNNKVYIYKNLIYGYDKQFIFNKQFLLNTYIDNKEVFLFIDKYGDYYLQKIEEVINTNHLFVGYDRYMIPLIITNGKFLVSNDTSSFVEYLNKNRDNIELDNESFESIVRNNLEIDLEQIINFVKSKVLIFEYFHLGNLPIIKGDIQDLIITQDNIYIKKFNQLFICRFKHDNEETLIPEIQFPIIRPIKSARK